MISEQPPTVATMLATLKPNPRNPRLIRDARFASLKRALQADPDMLRIRPVVANADGTVLMGNMRYRAALDLGWETIPCIHIDVDEQTATAWAIRDNQGYGDDDEAMLAELIYELRESGYDLDLTGIDGPDIDRLLDASGATGDTERGRVEHPIPDNPDTKPGDTYDIGPHRLVCGDATNRADATTLMAGDELPARLLFTSPPYGDARDYTGEGDLSPQHLAQFLPVFADLAQIIVVNLGMLREAGEVLRYWDHYIDAANSAGLKLLSWNVWDRASAWTIGQQTAMFPIEHEWLLVFGREPVQINLVVPNKDAGKVGGDGGIRYPDGSTRTRPRAGKVTKDHRELGTILRGIDVNRDKEVTEQHPASFPVELPAAYIKACTVPGDIVIDPFGGSGQTMVACDELQRRCRLLEIAPAYCDVIRHRLD